MGRLPLLLLLLPAALAGCVAEEPAALPAGQIDGAVVDGYLYPFANQTVHLSPLGWTDQTSRLGGFTFRGVPPGTYTVLAAREGTTGAGAVVEVTADRVTKTILQLLPVEEREPWMALFPSQTRHEDMAYPGAECESCSWTVPLGADRPAEVLFEARWSETGLGHDAMRFRIADDQGRTLASRVVASSPFAVSVDGADVPPDAQALRITAAFGQDFLARPNFRIDAATTLFHGATRAEMFG